jgi:aconitase B
MADLSDVVAVSIKQGQRTTIIAPKAKYELFDGRVLRVEPVADYKKEVEKAFNLIRDRAKLGFFQSEEYFIQLFGVCEDPKLR